MKIIYSISILLMICLVVISVPCPAGDLKSLPTEGFPSPLDETMQAKVAVGPSEFSLSEPLVSFHSTLDASVSFLEDQEPIQVALANIPPALPEAEEPAETIADPLEPVNRAFFQFNDKFYFWVLKPVATGYKTIIPEDGRVGVRNFFSNLTTPIRLVNCLLQAKFKGAGNETVRFLLNTGLGLAGFLDPAKKELNIEKEKADFGQTLGVWGIGPAFYINWPILGSSSLRDSIGFVGDLFLDPRTYVLNNPILYLVTPVELVNEASLTLGEYEDFKKATLDPYIALKDAYDQYRQNRIKGR